MKKLTILLTTLTVITSLVACSNKTETTPTTERGQQANTSTTNIITSDVSVTGKVTQIYGNEVIIRLAEATQATEDDKSTMRENMTEMSDDDKSAMRENMTEMSDDDKSAMRENMTEMSDDDRVAMRENMTERGERTTGDGTAVRSGVVAPMSISLSNTAFILNGGPGADRTTMSDSDREAMMSQMGDRTTMSGTSSATSTADIVLTNDIAEYVIPVGTPVYSMGTALSFSQIYKDNYVTIYMNKDGDIVSVNILG